MISALMLSGCGKSLELKGDPWQWVLEGEINKNQLVDINSFGEEDYHIKLLVENSFIANIVVLIKLNDQAENNFAAFEVDFDSFENDRGYILNRGRISKIEKDNIFMLLDKVSYLELQPSYPIHQSREYIDEETGEEMIEEIFCVDGSNITLSVKYGDINHTASHGCGYEYLNDVQKYLYQITGLKYDVD